MNRYNWQQTDWPDFKYSLEGLEDSLFSFAEKTGRISGILLALPDEAQQDAIVRMMLAEAVKTSEIEGEYLSREDVLSSIRKNLGLHYEKDTFKDRKAAGVGELMTDVRKTFREPLTQKKLFAWHKMLLGGSENIKVGAWRSHKEPMQVVSGAMGKERVHFEAPPSERVPEEMRRFLDWFNETGPEGSEDSGPAPVRSAVAHLYFESIHPFDDGNGRIGRAIAEKTLSQEIGRPAVISLSRTMEANKKAYYEALQKAQRSNEITGWVHYFVHAVLDAQDDAEAQIQFTLKKVKYLDRYGERLNNRQRKVLNRMLEEGPDGFEGGINTRKYVGLTRTSKSTATRDLQDLLEMGAIVRLGDAGGRSTRYGLNL